MASNSDHNANGEASDRRSRSTSALDPDDDDHQCEHPDCGKSYATRQGLVNHSKIHLTAAEKPFACDHPGCNKRYVSKVGVTRHYKGTHTDQSDWFHCPATECDASFFLERQLKLHQVEHGVYRCTASRCVYEFTSEQELYAHRERNHNTPNLYENRNKKASKTTSPPEACEEETGDEIVVGNNQQQDESSGNEHNEENDSSNDAEEDPGKRITKKAVLEKFEEYPDRPETKTRGWKCPMPKCSFYCKIKFELIAHWQEAHSEIPEPAHFASKQTPDSSDDNTISVVNTNPNMANSLRNGGQSTSTSAPQPARTEQGGKITSRDNLASSNTGTPKSNAIQWRGKATINKGNLTANVNDSSAAKATHSTPSVVISRSPAAPNMQSHAHVPRSNNGPSILPPRSAANTTRPNIAVSASSSGNSHVPPPRRPLNNRPTNPAVAATASQTRRNTTFDRTVENRRLSPPPARSNQTTKSTLASASVLLARNAVAKSSPSMTGSSRKPGLRQSESKFPRTRIQESTQSPSVDSSRRSTPEDSSDDDDDNDDEDGLFVSPPDTTKNQTTKNQVKGSGVKTLGVRGFANMAFPQDSDEEDLRPSHVLRQERLAAAGKSEKPIGRSGRFGNAGRSGELKGGKRTARASTRSDDSDDDFDNNFDGGDFSSSGSSFGETPRPGRRSTNSENSRPTESDRRRSTANPANPANPTDPPRTPSPDATRYNAYEVFAPDLDSPPPSYLIKSPGVIDRRLPYREREDGKFLTEEAAVQPTDLFDADDVHFTFMAPTPHEIEVQARLDAEKEAMRANALGSGFRAPMHFDHCPYTAPACVAERPAWIAERLRIDAAELRGDGFDDIERLLGMDRDDNSQSTSNANNSAFGKGRKATCAGPARIKRKYNWRDPDTKNKRHRGGVIGSVARDGSTRSSISRDQGLAQIDGADERVVTQVAAYVMANGAALPALASSVSPTDSLFDQSAIATASVPGSEHPTGGSAANAPASDTGVPVVAGGSAEMAIDIGDEIIGDENVPPIIASADNGSRVRHST